MGNYLSRHLHAGLYALINLSLILRDSRYLELLLVVAALTGAA
jgi:hypothetical protein